MLELDTHTVAMQEQCVPTKQAQLTVGWVGEPDKPNPANPQKLILGRSAWSARSAKSTVASSGQHLFNLRILQLLELVIFANLLINTHLYSNAYIPGCENYT